MSVDRRTFLSQTSAGLMAAGIGRRPDANRTMPRASRAVAGDPDLGTLAAAALDAAQQAGATYADVRFTLTRDEWVGVNSNPGLDACSAGESIVRGVGIRALADGAWGFAAGPSWTLDALVRLARESTAQARINARGRLTPVAWNPPVPAESGTWVMPVARDPFTVSLSEKYDVGMALMQAPGRLDIGAAFARGYFCTLRHRRQEKTFISTAGAHQSQTLFLANHQYAVAVERGRQHVTRLDDRLQPIAGGWEVAADPAVLDGIPALVDTALRMTYDEIGPIQPGRYDLLADALLVAQLAGRTLGLASELDRVLGYEANATGTSYLGPPETALGYYTFGAPLLTMTADRTAPGGVATVRWDDDGVPPDAYPVITKGVLADYHTTRELAPLLPGAPRRSHGCAGAENALGFPMVQPPNLTLHPDPQGPTFEALVAGLEQGLVWQGGTVTTDRQQLNGEINQGLVYEVREGKRVRRVEQGEALFRAPELWKSLQALGGPSTQRATGLVDVVKGQPIQHLSFGVTAVPARFKAVAVTDRFRKA